MIRAMALLVCVAVDAGTVDGGPRVTTCEKTRERIRALESVLEAAQARRDAGVEDRELAERCNRAMLVLGQVGLATCRIGFRSDGGVSAEQIAQTEAELDVQREQLRRDQVNGCRYE